jgi:IPT/TIG domain
MSAVGTVTSAKDSYRPPTVSGVSPTSGPTGSTVTIAGTSLTGTTKVSFAAPVGSADSVASLTKT